MPLSLPKDILDGLTDIAMPRLVAERGASEFVGALGFRLPVRRSRALVLGSGAAGLRAAVELKRRGIDVVVVTQSAFGGTSACSGSDKQTLHTANSADQGDDFRAMAGARGAGGAMDEDIAYVEAVGSARALASLQYLGLPIPEDRLGGVLRYQTDHDEVGRATSCGPRTSRLMVRALALEAMRLEIPTFNHTTAVQLLVAPGPPRRAAGLLTIRPKHRSAENPLGWSLFLADFVVIASGGPGELYRDSVYPRHCFGSLGMALEAGVETVNLTESQFGIGTSREGFPWNLSGTYVQCMPHVYSLDARGQEIPFLADYYRTTRELASNLFRKGYQWPFHASRMLDFGSSLFDLAVFEERRAGRRVFLDFNRNPSPVPGAAAFDLDDLDADAHAYLKSAGALLDKPIDRLRKMNPLSIELYKRYKYDITAAPLEFAINNQHMNGGLSVNAWGETNLIGCYAVGEAAGTHGVTRPGGAALNAGQVFGLRCAQHIAARHHQTKPETSAPEVLDGQLAEALGALRPHSSITSDAIQREVQARMSDHAGILCKAEDVRDALAGARALNAAIARQGVKYETAYEAARALQWRQMAIVSEAVLSALAFYIDAGGGSRGARAILAPEGTRVPHSRQGPLADVRFLPEREQDRAETVLVRREGDGFALRTRALRRRDRNARAFFEREWPDFLTGAIYESAPWLTLA